MILNDSHIEMCDDLVYLGLLFHYNGIILHSQKSLSDQGRNALFNLYSKIHEDCFNHETLLSLFDAYISCILNCECELWGSHKGEYIEQVHLNFLKRTLKVRRSTVNFIIYFELGRVPMYVERYSKIIKYWCKILKTENIVVKTCYEAMVESSERNFNQ
jgi:lipopolysaccharide biosynthesis regulator YciM